jgi:hypothetical protein
MSRKWHFVPYPIERRRLLAEIAIGLAAISLAVWVTAELADH